LPLRGRAFRRDVRRLGPSLPLRHPQSRAAHRPAAALPCAQSVSGGRQRAQRYGGVGRSVAGLSDFAARVVAGAPRETLGGRARYRDAAQRTRRRRRGHFSSGITSYRGAAYPEKYRGNVFVCECAGNLFYRLQLTPDGPTFKAARVDGSARWSPRPTTGFAP
jgi:hypothetical protein